MDAPVTLDKVKTTYCDITINGLRVKKAISKFRELLDVHFLVMAVRLIVFAVLSVTFFKWE